MTYDKGKPLDTIRELLQEEEDYDLIVMEMVQGGER